MTLRVLNMHKAKSIIHSDAMKTIQCAHPHHHNGFTAVCWLWPLWGWGWTHWIVFMVWLCNIYIYIYIYLYIYTYIYMHTYHWVSWHQLAFRNLWKCYYNIFADLLILYYQLYRYRRKKDCWIFYGETYFIKLLFSIFKACVCYFQTFIFSPNDSSSETMKNVFYFI